MYPNQIEESIGMIEMCVGGGLAFGPVIGGYLYFYTNYEWSFAIITLVYFIFSILFCFFLNVNLYPELKKSEEEEMKLLALRKEDSKNLELNFLQIVKNKDFMLTLFVDCLSYTGYTFIQPSFSEHIKSYGGDSDEVGLIYAVSDLMYAFTAIMLIKYFKSFQRKNLFLFGGICSFISMLLIGPEPLLFLPKSLIVVGTGMGLLGFAQVFYTTPIIPEFIDILTKIFGKKESINEMACGMFNASIALAEFLGPLTGGILTDYFGFERALTCYALALLCYLVFFAIFRNLDFGIKSNENLKEMETVLMINK